MAGPIALHGVIQNGALQKTSDAVETVTAHIKLIDQAVGAASSHGLLRKLTKPITKTMDEALRER